MIHLLIDWLIDHGCDAYHWWTSYNIFLLIEHQMTLISTTMNIWSSPYILTHNWKLFFLIVWCSVCVTGCHHISSHIRSTKGLHTHIMAAMYTLGAHLLFLLICAVCMCFSLTDDDDDDDIKWLSYQPWRTLGPHYTFTIYSKTYWPPNDYIHFYFIDFLL